MATLPAYSPEIPYLGLIPGGVQHGTTIRICGTMPYGGNRFAINLQTGAATRPRDDSALHLSVRPTEPVIVRNHYENKIWGNEERFGGCPIYPGQPFEISILAESTAFKISINGAHFCHFTHRLSMHRITFIAVESDISVTSITLNEDAPPVPMPVPYKPYTASLSYPVIHHGLRPHYPHHHGASHLPGFVPGAPYPPTAPYAPGAQYVPGPPPPPPYSPTPYPGHRPHYIHPRDQMANPATPAFLLDNDSDHLKKKKKKNKALAYAAAAAGIGGGVGLTAYALSRGFGGGGDGDGDGGGGGDDGGDDVGVE